MGNRLTVKLMQDSRLTAVYDGYQTELTKSGKGCQSYPGNHPLQGQQKVKVYTEHQTLQGQQQHVQE